MGGNGTFASGNVVKFNWRTVGTSHGAKVLAPVSGSWKLPEEAHGSRLYILNTKDGRFRQLRIYDKDHRLRFEIGFHPERKLDKSGKEVLHYHVIKQPGFEHGPAHLATEAMKKKFGKYMEGVAVE